MNTTRQGRWMRRRIGAGVTLAAVAAVAAGCGSSGDSATSTSSGSQSSAAALALEPYLKRPASLPSYPKLDKPVPRGKLIAYLEPSPNETSSLIGDGVQAASKVIGWRYRAFKFDRANPAGGNSAMLSAINAGADVVVAGVPTPQAYRAALAAAKAKGVIVVMAAPNGNSVGVPGVVAQVAAAQTPNTARPWGMVPALGIVADAQASGSTAHIGVVTSADLVSLFKLIDGQFSATVLKYCPKCTVKTINVPLADLASGRSGKDVVSFLQRHPEVQYLKFDAGLFETGVRPALNSVGLSKIKIFGAVPSSAQLEEMNKGGSQGWLYADEAAAGWQAVDAALRAMTGGNPAIHDDEPQPTWFVTPKAKVAADPLPAVPLNVDGYFRHVWGLD